MARRNENNSVQKRKSKSANHRDYISQLDSKLQSRVRDLEDKLSKGKFAKEIRISFDTIAKSDSKAFGYFVSNATNRSVIQLWTEAWKLDQIFKKKIIKATKYWEGNPLPEERASENMISLDIYENIFVAKGFKTLLTATKSLRLLHLVGIKFSQDSWEYLNEGISNNYSLYKISINRCPMRPENLQAIVPSLGKHELIETLDLSANGIEDDCGALIASVIKNQAERRDNNIWIKALRKKIMKRITGMKVPRKSINGKEKSFNFNPFHGFGLTKIVLRK